jgi:hypothetical protein
MQAYTRVAKHHVFVLRYVYWHAANMAFRHSVLYSRGRGRRPIALCIVLGLMMLCTTSGPHAVHHLFDQQHPECLVFFLMQSTPVTTCVVTPLSALLPAGAQAVADQWLCPIAEPRALVYPRAPPTAHPHSPLSDCGNRLPGKEIEVLTVL